MTDNFVHGIKDDRLKLKIVTEDNVETGDYLEFDFEDVDLLLRYQEMLEKNKKNREWIRNQAIILQKRPDVKGKKFLSRNEEDMLKSVKEFFNKQVEIYNMFLGENGVQKLLCGRKLTWTTLQEIDEIIETQIAPHIKGNLEDITKKIKEKYSHNKSEENVLK